MSRLFALLQNPGDDIATNRYVESGLVTTNEIEHMIQIALETRAKLKLEEIEEGKLSFFRLLDLEDPNSIQAERRRKSASDSNQDIRLLVEHEFLTEEKVKIAVRKGKLALLEKSIANFEKGNPERLPGEFAVIEWGFKEGIRLLDGRLVSDVVGENWSRPGRKKSALSQEELDAKGYKRRSMAARKAFSAFVNKTETVRRLVKLKAEPSKQALTKNWIKEGLLTEEFIQEEIEKRLRALASSLIPGIEKSRETQLMKFLQSEEGDLANNISSLIDHDYLTREQAEAAARKRIAELINQRIEELEKSGTIKKAARKILDWAIKNEIKTSRGVLTPDFIEHYERSEK